MQMADIQPAANDPGQPGQRRPRRPLTERKPAIRHVVLCVGAQKAGTTWLHDMLTRHADFHAAPVKEVHFWDGRLNKITKPFKEQADARLRKARSTLEKTQGRPRRHAKAKAKVKRWELWRQVMSRGGRPGGYRAYERFLLDGHSGQSVVGEFSPSYQLLRKDELAEIVEWEPGVRFIFLMRQPVARFWSGIKHSVRQRLLDGTISEAQVQERFDERLDDRSSLERRRSDYRATIKRLDAAVGAERVQYLFYENLFEAGYLDATYEFLGLDPIPTEAGLFVNETRNKSFAPTEAQLQRAHEVFAPVTKFVVDRFGPAVPEAWTGA